MKIKALIADDSVVYRSLIRAALLGLPWVEVVGAASNGRLAIAKMLAEAPDLLILDLEMPDMDGLETLREMQRQGLKCKVLVFSSASRRGAAITMDALRLGATDFIAKPGSGGEEVAGNPADRIADLLLPRVNALFPRGDEATRAIPPVQPGASRYPSLIWDLVRPRLVVIGASTGGPSALEVIFSELGGPVNCPIVIAQHMPPVFTHTFADRLGKASGIPSGEAKHGEILQSNRIYVAPGDFHVRIKGTPDRAVLALDQGPAVHSVRPAVDPLFSTAASVFQDKCLAFVLTGMGEDGKTGAAAVKQAGGAVVIQDAGSCVVFGMPGAVQAAGAYDRMANPNEIAEILREKTGIGRAAAACGGK